MNQRDPTIVSAACTKSAGEPITGENCTPTDTVNRLPEPIEWLSDNGSPYTAGETRRFAREIGLTPRTTPVSSPQSNGMAEAFVRTLKRDYVRIHPTPDAQTVIDQLPAWLAHYNDVHPHKALGYRSPREYITQTRETPSGL